jgi:hypothetical protein
MCYAIWYEDYRSINCDTDLTETKTKNINRVTHYGTKFIEALSATLTLLKQNQLTINMLRIMIRRLSKHKLLH